MTQPSCFRRPTLGLSPEGTGVPAGSPQEDLTDHSLGMLATPLEPLSFSLNQAHTDMATGWPG